jgi:hypothetical protein
MPQRVRSTAAKGFFGRIASFLASHALKQMATDRFNGLLRNAWMLGATELRIIHTYGGEIRAVGFERVDNSLKETFTATSLDSDDYRELLLRFDLEESSTCSPQVLEFGEPHASVTIQVTKHRSLRSETLILHLDFDPSYSSLAD